MLRDPQTAEPHVLLRFSNRSDPYVLLRFSDRWTLTKFLLNVSFFTLSADDEGSTGRCCATNADNAARHRRGTKA